MEKQAKRIQDQAVRGMLLHDINAISLSFTSEQALLAVELFLTKWEASENATVLNVTAHFRAQWTNNHVSNWTRGHCPNCVINNNGLEATNGVIKNEVTQRRLLPVLNFFVEISKWLTSQSTRRDPANPNPIPFTSVHTIVTTNWTEAYRWSKDTARQLRITNDGVYVAVNSDVRGDLTDEKAANFVAMFTDFSFGSFDDFTKTSNNVCVIRPDLTRQEGYNCTCKVNAKEHSCNHSIGVAIIRATLVPPREAKVTLLGRNRKRGRKPQAAPAWQHQPFDIVSPQHHPQQNPAILAGVAAPPNGPLNAQNAMLEEHIEEPNAIEQ